MKVIQKIVDYVNKLNLCVCVCFVGCYYILIVNFFTVRDQCFKQF